MSTIPEYTAPGFEPPPLEEMAPTKRRNILGLVGFIVSLFGLLCTCGLLCPIGLLVSLIAAFKPPRGFAIAGLVIGFLGTVGIIAVALSPLPREGMRLMNTVMILQAGHEAIVAHQGANSGQLPDSDNWKTVLEQSGVATVDGWDRELRYTPNDDGTFDLRSACFDGKFDTEDDLVSDELAP